MIWENVTKDCAWEDDELCHHHGDFCTPVSEANGYRVRLAHLWDRDTYGDHWEAKAFIVEKSS